MKESLLNNLARNHADPARHVEAARRPGESALELGVEDLARLVGHMSAVCDKLGGLGLAAPQLGLNYRVCLVNLNSLQAIALLNPEVLASSAGETIEGEGCLSLPGKTVQVARSNQVTVLYLTAEGRKCVKIFRGKLARVVQHEIDHLDGRLITDYHA